MKKIIFIVLALIIISGFATVTLNAGAQTKGGDDGYGIDAAQGGDDGYKNG